jgi:hypothetical protein
MSKKYFPIVTESACRLKWAWSSVYLTTGVSSSCHRSGHDKLTKDNFGNFHNLETKIKDRSLMLQGKWGDSGCDYCKTIEDSGGYSDRQYQLTIPDVYPPELDNNSTLTHVEPVILEIFFKNTCNLMCIYCHEQYSSSIDQENKKFGEPIHIKSRVASQDQYSTLAPLMWEWLENNVQKLHRLHILGGEPLIQEDFSRLIELLNRKPNPRLELNVISNLIVKEKVLKDAVTKLNALIVSKKIRRIDFFASVDSWGPGQEYVRTGFDMKVFKNNFDFLLKNTVFKLGIFSTVTSLSIFEMPNLLKMYKQWSEHRKIFWNLHLVLPEDHVLSPIAFDYSEYSSYFSELEKNLESINFEEDITKKLVQGFSAKLSTNIENKQMQKNLIEYLNEIDRRRNLNWQNTFPWLKKYVV